MNRFLKILMFSIFAVFLCIGNAWATPVVDGVFNESEYSSVFSEDTEADYYLDPGYGGQPYDVEYLGLSIVGTRLYFGLQAGLKLEYGEAAIDGNLRPGDLAINIGNNDTWDFGIRFWDDTIKVLDADPLGWDSVAYLQHNVSDPWRVSDPDAVIAVDFFIAFNDEPVFDDYDQPTYSLEGWIDLDALGWEEGMSVASHFTMACGNDFGETSIPEPATMLLLGIGLIGVAGIGRKKFK